MQYLEFTKLTQYDDYITNAWVEKQYRKKSYWVLKLRSEEGFSFYTSSNLDLKPIEGEFVRVKLWTEKLDFLSFLQGFYAPSSMLGRLEGRQERYELMKELATAHSTETAPVFNALFFAGSIPAPLRHQLSALGINHLLAISGFHLGVLSFILFFIFKSVYQPLQGRYFPYRNAHFDIAVAIFIVLFSYLHFLDFVPSLLRAFSMSLFAYFLYDRGIKILSFSSLLLVVSFLIALWPKLLFALGFWFSVAGVFYIFLFLHHMKELKSWQNFILLHLWVYLAMLPLVHYFYGSFSLYQLYSPLLTMLFILFYPLALFLHLFAMGFLLDPLIAYILALQIRVVELYTEFRLFLLYLFLSFLAVFKKLFFYLLLLFCLGFFGYLLYGIAEF